MPFVPKRWLGSGLLVLCASGCAALMGVDDPVLGDPLAAAAAGADASAEARATASDAASSVDAEPPPCTTNPDSCVAVGSYCANGHCTPGCKSDAECNTLSSAAPLCNLTRHQCVSCLDDKQCTNGKHCSPAGACVDTCSLDGGGCGAGQLCCAGFCIDPKTDVFNCGKCDLACSTLNGAPKCDNALCKWTCADGFAHCTTSNTGCETDIAHDINNCGQCSHVCSGAAAIERCSAGKCDVTSCTVLFTGDCNNKPEDGCECICGGKSLPGAGSHCCPGKFCWDGQCGQDNICGD